VVVLGAFGLLGNDSVGDVRHEQAVSRAGEEASGSAERAAAAVLAYDYRHLDADKAAALPFLTSSFQKQYERTFQRVVRPTALQVHARVTADVQDSGVIRATPDAVKVLVFVDQTTASTAHPGERTSLNRVEMDMRKVGQSWKVDQITVY
jgi:Mce-associated membrane protein